MTTKEILAAGYAIPSYDINKGTRSWRVGEGCDGSVINLPMDAVPLHELPGVDYRVAKIEDVMVAKIVQIRNSIA